MSQALLVNITGVIGVLINVFSLTRTSDKALRAFIGVGFGVWAVNNWLLSAYTACALCGVAMSRQAAASLMPEHLSKPARAGLCGFFLALILGLSAWTWNSWGTVLACTSSFFSTYAMFYLGGVRLRFTVGIAYALWCASTVWYHAWWAVAANILLAATAFWKGYMLLRAEQESAAFALSVR